MPRGREREPGIKALPNVPYRNDEAYPNHYDNDTARGPLCAVPREPIYRATDYGDDRIKTGGLGAPCRADFTAGRPTWTPEIRDRRVLPESQLPGSMNTMAGLGTPRTSRQLIGEGGPLLPRRDRTDREQD